MLQQQPIQKRSITEGPSRMTASSWLHSPQGACAEGSTKLCTVPALEKQAARADATWRGKKKTTLEENFIPFCLSLKVGMRSASLIFSLSSVQHCSQTSPHSRGWLPRSQDAAKSYASPAQLSSPVHVLSLYRAHTV